MAAPHYDRVSAVWMEGRGERERWGRTDWLFCREIAKRGHDAGDDPFICCESRAVDVLELRWETEVSSQHQPGQQPTVVESPLVENNGPVPKVPEA